MFVQSNMEFTLQCLLWVALIQGQLTPIQNLKVKVIAQVNSAQSQRDPTILDAFHHETSFSPTQDPIAAHYGPYFDKTVSKNVTVSVGKTAYLHCRVKNLGNKTNAHQVSWVRHRDVHLLTVGQYTYTTDQRFRVIHNPPSDDWTLQIKYPQRRDTGVYECQIGTTPHLSIFLNLNVVEPMADILGGPEMFIDKGSTINLTCIVNDSPEPPAYIFWNHNDAIISYDSPRGGVSVMTEKGLITRSFLLIQSARSSDSGRYQCNPSNAQARSISVHVLNGEHPEAMQHGGDCHHRSSHLLCLFVAACWLLYKAL